MHPILSICIPTYNRAKYLKVCLNSVLFSAEKTGGAVEVIVSDNCSNDETDSVIQEFKARFSCLRHNKNIRNLGYVGNQVRCLELAQGEYIAILCDDDAYLEGQVDVILQVLSHKKYSFVALNYCAFYEDVQKPFKKDFAPRNDVEFGRAYDIMNYPSVGHFSGYVFNACETKEVLKKVLDRVPLKEYEKHRGIIYDLATRTTLASALPSYFIGRIGLAARAPETTDYDLLQHSCLDYFGYFDALYREGNITENDLRWRKQVVLSILPRAIIANLPRMDKAGVEEVMRQLSKYFGGCRRYEIICLPLLKAGKYAWIRKVYALATGLYRCLKRIRRRMNVGYP